MPEAVFVAAGKPLGRQSVAPPQKCLKKVWWTTLVTSDCPTTFLAAANRTSAFWTRGFTEHVLKTARDCSSCPVDLAEKASCGSSKPWSLTQVDAGCCCWASHAWVRMAANLMSCNSLACSEVRGCTLADSAGDGLTGKSTEALPPCKACS